MDNHGSNMCLCGQAWEQCGGRQCVKTSGAGERVPNVHAQTHTAPMLVHVRTQCSCGCPRTNRIHLVAYCIGLVYVRLSAPHTLSEAHPRTALIPCRRGQRTNRLFCPRPDTPFCNRERIVLYCYTLLCFPLSGFCSEGCPAASVREFVSK